MFNPSCAIFIISCETNQQVVNLLIQSMRQQISHTVSIYVSSDGPLLITDPSVRVLIGQEEVFGDRVVTALEQVTEERVIVFCDDFIVEKPAKVEELEELLSLMEEDTSIASIALSQISGGNTSERIAEHYIRRTKYAPYKTTLQCAIWKKSSLIQFMKGSPSPWEFEIYHNFKTYLTKEKFYALEDDMFQPIPYNRGKLIIRGKVVKPEKERLEELLGYSLDLSDFPETESFVQGENLTVGYRLKRKIKLLEKEIIYRLKSKIKNKKE